MKGGQGVCGTEEEKEPDTVGRIQPGMLAVSIQKARGL